MSTGVWVWVWRTLEEVVYMRPGHHWLCEFGDASDDTSCDKELNLSQWTWENYRGFGTHDSTKKTVLSSSISDSTEWKRIRRDSRFKSGHLLLTHHGHLWLYWSTPASYVPLISSARKFFLEHLRLEEKSRGDLRTRGAGLWNPEVMGPKRFVLSVDDDTEFWAQCEWMIPFFTLKYTFFQ